MMTRFNDVGRVFPKGNEGGCFPNAGPYFTVEFFHGHGQLPP